MIIWLTGLSGAGKTTIGKALYSLMRAKQKTVVLIDGDDIRRIVGDDLGYDIDSRKINAFRISRFCNYLESQNIDVVCCTMSLFEDVRTWNKEHCKNFYEVYIDVPVKRLIERDIRGLYKKAISGAIKNVVGIDLDYEPPSSPDLRIINETPFKSPLEIAQFIFDNLVLNEALVQNT